MKLQDPLETIFVRVYTGINCQDPLIESLIDPVPEVCRPLYQRELSEGKGVGCLKMTLIIGRTALSVDYGVMTKQEAVNDVKALSTCEDCPLKNFK